MKIQQKFNKLNDQKHLNQLPKDKLIKSNQKKCNGYFYSRKDSSFYPIPSEQNTI